MLSHPTYRTINGREYVLVSHATSQMLGMTNDSLEVAADMAAKWFKSGDDGLAAAIRDLKQDGTPSTPLPSSLAIGSADDED
jgi:hypothetical protein